MSTIRSLFSARRPIDRPIEKVIDYYATDESRLAAEVEEYEVTDNIERCFRKFLDIYGDGVRGGKVAEIGIWISGFYGSGKSSFTKYLGFALDPERKVAGRLFLDLLCERLKSADVQASLRTLAKQQPTTVILLDLGAEQLVENASAPVSTVLYWKVLQWAGYSKEKKLAYLEFTLDAKGLTEKFRELYRKKFSEEWETIHNDPLIGVARAAQIVPQVLPTDFPTSDSFSKHRFDEALDVRTRAQQMIGIVRKKTGKGNILFLIDEAGQYVAPRGELILNLDGLARSLKELGQGKVWIAATGQQTLAEIVEKAAHNSAELNKLRDRFPISIELDAHDIREITYRRLLTKAPEGERRLKDEFGKQGQALVTHTQLEGTALFTGAPDADTFARLYPLLPQHFDLLLELIRTLARSTGGIGLRSAIRVIQDLLVDVSKVLPASTTKIADRPIGHLTCIDDCFDTLRADIGKVLPHVAMGADRVAKVFPTNALAIRVAKAIAAVQAIEGFPKTPENIAALLYPKLGSPSLLNDVRETLLKLAEDKECSITKDPTGGYLYLSEGVKPLRDKRNAYVPTSAEMNQERSKVLQALIDPPPSAKIENIKEVKAGVRFGKVSVVDPDAEVQFHIIAVDGNLFSERRTELLSQTNAQPEYKKAIAWLVSLPAEIDDQLAEICRSEQMLRTTSERDADRDVAQFLRAERRRAEEARDRGKKLIEAALLAGTFIFLGRPKAVTEAGATLETSTRGQLAEAANEIFPYLRLVPIRPSTEVAAKFLSIERLDRMTSEFDPLRLVQVRATPPKIDLNHAAIAETLRAFQEKVDQLGTGRIQGSALQESFSSSPYGWTKDATRYLFAALFVAGEVELHTPEGVIKTAGPAALEAFKSTLTFNRVGVSRRNGRPTLEALDRAATNLQSMFGIEVLQLEDHISRAVRAQIPGLIEKVASLPVRLRLLGLTGETRALRLLETATDLLKQDASGATALLGGTDCSLPADVKWAKAVTDALSAGAEAEINKARTLQISLIELRELFPSIGTTLISSSDEAAIREALGSENCHEHVPALRAAIRSTVDRVKAAYAAHRAGYGAALQSSINTLEAMPEWARIAAEDREDIAGKFRITEIAESPDEGRLVSAFRLLLTREAGLVSLLKEAEEEVRRRTPSQPTPPSPLGTVTEEVIDMDELIPPDAIRTKGDLDVWITSLRSRLEELLKASKVIRLGRGTPKV